MLSLPQSYTGPHIWANWKVNLVVYQKQKHLLLSEVTWGFILIPLCLWKADEVEKWDKTEKIQRTFHLPHPYFNKSQGEWENGQLHVIVSQRMSAGSRDLTKIFSCKMAWSGHQKFCVISLMTWQWQWQFVGHLMVMCNRLTASLLEEESDTFFQIKVKKEYFKICWDGYIRLLKPCYKINVLNHITYSLLQVVENNLNPRWKAFQIPVQQICNGDYDRTIQVSIFWSDNADFVNHSTW